MKFNYQKEFIDANHNQRNHYYWKEEALIVNNRLICMH